MAMFIAIYLAVFAFLSWTRFRWAVGLLIISLPAYLVRFNLGPLPTTLLETSFAILFLIWLIKYARIDWPNIQYLISNNRWFTISCFLFFISSVVSIFISDMWWYSTGQWRAYFLEPMLFFVMLIGRLSPSPYQGEAGRGLPSSALPRADYLTSTGLILSLILSTLSISIFGIIQLFTGWHIGNADLTGGRITSFFLSPNAVGLYLGPTLLLALTLITKQISSSKHQILKYFNIKIFALILITLFLTKSLGAWIAVGVGILIFLFLIGYKKIAISVAILSLLISFTPPIQSLISSKAQSTSNRLTLWSYSWNYLSASPKNFVFGTGIRQFFRKIQKPYYNPKELERLIYPHNIFLNFWTEVGLLGLISFVGIYYSLLSISYSLRKTNKFLSASLFSALAVLLIHGFIDVPYFKNDLAMMFWVVAAIVISSKNQINGVK